MHIRQCILSNFQKEKPGEILGKSQGVTNLLRFEYSSNQLFIWISTLKCGSVTIALINSHVSDANISYTKYKQRGWDYVSAVSCEEITVFHSFFEVLFHLEICLSHLERKILVYTFHL